MGEIVMSEYKRLTNNNIEEYDPEYDFCMGCEFYGKYHSCDRPNGICANFERFIATYNRLAELEDKIENGTLVLSPKYKLKQKVYLLMCGNIISGTIDGFDIFKQKYLVFIDDTNDYGELGFGNEWFFERELFPTKAKAVAKLRELKGGELV